MTSRPKNDIDLDNPEFQNVWKLINYTHQSLFMTGKAGTGKSTFLKYIKENTRKRHVVLAPTGIAAVNVGGSTLHSFFKIPFKPLLPDDPDFMVSRLRKRLKYSKSHQKLIKELELIIIDEISMVRADLIDFVDKVLRVYSGNMREPFGGKQMLFVGDIFQLEPVVTSDMRDVLRQYYRNSYFFSASVFNDFEIVPIELRRIYRQQDQAFISMLDRFRIGSPTADDVNCLNARVAPDYIPSPDNFVMTLATRRDMVDHINEFQLSRLTTPEITYIGVIKDDFPDNALPTSRELVLKVGAQVVFVKNDRDKRWVNGSVGRVTMATDDFLEVELENGDRVSVDREIWNNVVYKYDERDKRVIEKVIGSFEQYPVRLAWALTIHKSQGLTFNNVIIDIGHGAFSGGQSYVALSRCTSLEGIILKSTINPRDVFVNPIIIDFSRRFNDMSLVGAALESAQADDAYFRSAKAFDNGEYTEAVNAFADAVNRRNELSRPTVVRLISRKFNKITSQEAEINRLRLELEANKVRFQELAAEYVAMGRDCLDEYDDVTAALANFNKALSIADDLPAAWLGKGQALYRSGDCDLAVIALKEAMRLDPSSMQPELELGAIYLEQEQYHEALNILLAAAQRHRDEPLIHLRLAVLYEKIGDEESAAFHRDTASRLKSRRSTK